MGLRADLLRLPLESRFAYDAEQERLFANFEGCVVRSVDDVAAIRAALESKLIPIGHKVAAIVDYDNFHALPDLLDAYTDMVRDIADAHYLEVTRYTTAAFTHANWLPP